MSEIIISTKAVAQLKDQLVNSCLEAGIGFRMDVIPDESGKFTFSIRIDRQHQGDKVFESDGIQLFLDPASAYRIKGYQLDYEDKSGDGFFLSTMNEARSR